MLLQVGLRGGCALPRTLKVPRAGKPIDTKIMREAFSEKRSEPRQKADKYASVEFIIEDLVPVHLFPVYNVSSTGIGIIAREGSAALKHLKVGRIIEAKFTRSKAGSGFENCKVEIRHITKDGAVRFKGHYLIGLSILELESEP